MLENKVIIYQLVAVVNLKLSIIVEVSCDVNLFSGGTYSNPPRHLGIRGFYLWWGS